MYIVQVKECESLPELFFGPFKTRTRAEEYRAAARQAYPEQVVVVRALSAPYHE